MCTQRLDDLHLIVFYTVLRHSSSSHVRHGVQASPCLGMDIGRYCVMDSVQVDGCLGCTVFCDVRYSRTDASDDIKW